MKKLLLIIFLLLAFSVGFGVNAYAATTYYVDYAVGDDTNDGSAWGAGNAWKTLDTHTGVTAGDTVRLAKTTPTALTGNLTFTSGSVSVSTASDLTGELAAGDFIQLDDDDARADGMWWEVASLTSSVVTLEEEYYGTGGTGAAHEMNALQRNAATDDDVDFGGSAVDYVYVIGGWNTTSGLRDGWTFYDGIDNSTNAYAGGTQADYIHMTYVGLVRYASALYLYASDHW